MRFQHTLTKENFEHWLSRKGASRMFRPEDSYSCPIARFLQDSGYKKAYVGVTTADILINNKTKTFKLPKWAAKFVLAFDNTFANQSKVRGSKVASVLLGKTKK